MATWVCSACSAENPEGTRFCGQCGTAASAAWTCAACSAENQAGTKFCGQCGTPAAGAPPPEEKETPSEERRVMTALFTDIVGSTASAEAMDPEDVHRRLQPYFERTRRELERFGGTLEKYVGDAVVAIFGAPVAHEDDPERAVRAALAIRDAIHELNESDSWLDLSIRIGVNTGEALLVVSDNPALDLGMAAGDAINTAARIQSAAPVNGVLVGEMTYLATRRAIEYREAEPIAAKGKGAPVPVWEAVHALERTHERLAREGSLVGREAELDRLRELWASAQENRQTTFAFVLGTPGVGKSRLLEELASEVADDGAAHWGRCLPYGEGITYWPLSELVKSIAWILQTDDSSAIGAKLGELLESLNVEDLDELRTMAAAVSNLLGVPTTPRGTYQTEQITQAELHWGLRRIFQLLARQRPLTLVFEDLHWAEPTLLEFIEFLIDDDSEVPLLVIGSARPEAAEAAPGLVRDSSRASTLRLDALTHAAGEALLRELLGSDELASAPAAAKLLQTAGGNPLFLEETVQALREAGLVDEHGWHLPEGVEELPTPTTLQGLIGSRLDQLPRREKRFAQHASVVGSVFWPGAVAHLQGDGSAQNGDLARRLQVLERRDLVREHEVSSVAGEREYGFKHIFIRDVAYGQLPKGRRIELHMRFAEWMRSLLAEELVEIVAWHLERACRLAREVARSPVEPPVAEAVAALIRAGEKAGAHEGMREADRFYARALELIDEDDEAAVDLRVRRGESLQVLGKIDEAVALLQPIAENVSSSVRPDLACRAVLALSQVAFRQGRASEASERLTEALELATLFGDSRYRVLASFGLASLEGETGAVAEALDRLAAAIGVAEEIDDRALQVQGHLRMGFLLYNKGDLAASEEHLERCMSLAADLGSTRNQALATFLVALIKYLRGDLGEAERLGEQAHAWLERTGDTYLAIQNLVALAQYALARDDVELAEARLREALPLALAQGNWLVTDVYRFLAIALVRQGRVDDARQLVEFAARDLVDEHLPARASLHIAEATVAAAAGDGKAAAERFEEAVTLFAQLDMPIDLCQARLAYARSLREAGALDAARSQLEPARETCATIGAIGLLTEVERELSFVGSGAGVPGPASKSV